MILGIDLGGTKIAFAAFTKDAQGSIRRVWPTSQSSERIATPPSYQGTLDAISEFVDRLDKNTVNISVIGAGLPGAISPKSGQIKNANSEWLIGKAVGRDLQTRLSRPVLTANDANCFALAEAGSDTTFGVILGTGVGGGLVVGGQVIEGVNGVAGEWGHLTLPDDSLVEGLPPNPMRPCYCGNRGCIETLLSGPGFATDFLLSLIEDPDLLAEAIQLVHGVDTLVEAQEVASLADAPNLGGALRGLFGSKQANDQDLSPFPLSVIFANRNRISGALQTKLEEACRRYGLRLAAALKTVVQIADPEIVLGGGMSKLPGLLEMVKKALPRAIFNASRDASLPEVRVRLSRHGDDAGVIGAAMLAAKSSNS